MRKWLQFFVTVFIVSALGTATYFWIDRYQTPTVRDHAETPLFTVGSPAKAESLRQGKQVREWGPLPGFTFYPGSVAFKNIEEAREWLTVSGKALKNWKIYQLSGDFNLDTHTVRGLFYTNKTLLISHEVMPDHH